MYNQQAGFLSPLEAVGQPKPKPPQQVLLEPSLRNPSHPRQEQRAPLVVSAQLPPL
uniref:Uncharacterized protein n=1 Tax=Echeneis naucrates TaxID=173247 RepID=A0A665TUL4_ECHNA